MTRREACVMLREYAEAYLPLELDRLRQLPVGDGTEDLPPGMYWCDGHPTTPLRMVLHFIQMYDDRHQGLHWSGLDPDIIKADFRQWVAEVA